MFCVNSKKCENWYTIGENIIKNIQIRWALLFLGRKNDGKTEIHLGEECFESEGIKYVLDN